MADRAQTAPGAPKASRLTALWMVATVLIAAGVVVAIVLNALRPPPYSQATPGDVLASMTNLIREDRAELIPSLIYADNVEYRATLTRTGQLFRTVQKLGSTVNRRFPREVQVLRAKLKQDLAGKGGSVVGAMMTASPAAQQKLAAASRNRADPGNALEDAAMHLLADPFGWAIEIEDRLSVLQTADDLAVITFDKEPFLGGLFTIRKIDGKWWLVMPLQLPGVNQFTPQTRNEWRILASLIRVVDNALKEVDADVAAGKAARLQDIPRIAGEKAFIPAAMVMVMYGKEMDVRHRRERALGAFRKRWSTYLNARPEDGPTRDALNTTVSKAAIEELDALIRKRTADPKAAPPMPVWASLTDDEVMNLASQWIASQGGRIDLKQPVSTDQIALADRAIEAKARSGIRTKPAPINPPAAK